MSSRYKYFSSIVYFLVLSTKKKHSSLNRTELGDYLLKKLTDTENIEIAVEAPLDDAIMT